MGGFVQKFITLLLARGMQKSQSRGLPAHQCSLAAFAFPQYFHNISPIFPQFFHNFSSIFPQFFRHNFRLLRIVSSKRLPQGAPPAPIHQRTWTRAARRQSVANWAATSAATWASHWRARNPILSSQFLARAARRHATHLASSRPDTWGPLGHFGLWGSSDLLARQPAWRALRGRHLLARLAPPFGHFLHLLEWQSLETYSL